MIEGVFWSVEEERRDKERRIATAERRGTLSVPRRSAVVI